ncbi:protein AF-9 isoform X6 [Acanthochromis polyacanthus]|uniref:protein AF-9 isoform X6 n=1 Tax=Acanthochromis polyacanthus TaxID=80966 RepID=UPI0022349FEA|nr:protein AF-9 isoform X6 [Acanthochromis polyacanthus]
MASSGAVQVKLELGHRAQVRKKPTVEGFTHDWMVFVRGPEHSNIQHFVEKVVFHLHESFPKPKRVCKDPPYKVEESGYAGFILPIEVYFKNKEEPKKVRFDYDLFLHLEGHPPVNHLRCEKLTFNNPTEEFRRKLLKAGGQRDPHKRSSEDSKVMVMQEGSTSLFGQHLKLPTLPNSSLTSSFSDPKKSKSFYGSKSEQPSPASSSSSSGFAPTHHKRQVLGPLQSVMQDLHSEDNDDDSDDDDDNDVDSDADRPAHTHLMHHQRRVSLSDGSESESSSPSPPSRNEAPPLLKTTNTQILEVKSPTKQSKQDKSKNIDCDKAYLDELVELHKRLMALREGHILQQIVNLIEETGHFHITNTTFDFDLCSLDRSTVRKLQSYLETSGLS